MSDQQESPVFQVVFAYSRGADDFIIQGVYTEPEKALEHMTRLKDPKYGFSAQSVGTAQMDFEMVAKQFIAGFLSMVGRHPTGSNEDIVFTLRRSGGIHVERLKP